MSVTNTSGVARPRMLFLCQTLPFPPDGGVEIRTYNILRLLSRTFDITALCFYRRATRGTAEQVCAGIEGLSRYCDVEAFPIPHEHNRLRLLWDHARSVLGRRAYTNFTYESRRFAARLQQLLASTDFDIVHLDSLDLSAYVPSLGGLPVVCTHQNVESDLLRRRAQTEPTALMRWYVSLQAAFTEVEERRFCPAFSLNVAVSDDDARRIREIAPGARVAVVPNGVDTSVFKPASQLDGTQGLVFVGGYSWYPNRDAMEYFCREILPLLRERTPNLALTWVGRAPQSVADHFRDTYGVQLTGYVEDIRPHVYRSECFIVPLRVGGGSRLKILDAWAMGMPVVSTSVGCEGLDARDGENILIRDTPATFAAAVQAVLTDAPLQKRLRDGARRTAVGRYDWEVLARRLTDEYMGTIGGPRSHAPDPPDAG